MRGGWKAVSGFPGRSYTNSYGYEAVGLPVELSRSVPPDGLVSP